MDRRAFLKTAGFGLGAAALGADPLNLFGDDNPTPTPSPGPSPKAKSLKNWVWVPGLDKPLSADDWKRQFAWICEGGIDAIVAEVYDGRQAYFASTRLPVKQDVLGTILPLAKAEGLEVHAWMWSMPCMVPEIMQKHPDWYNVNAKGESALDKPAYVPYYRFLDPGRPEVREWVQGTVKELASIPELTGINLDYIRHPDAILPVGLWKKYDIVQDKVYPPYDYGYTAYERQEFKKKYGVDPMQLKDPNGNPEWFQFRLDMVVDLVNDYLVPAAHAKGKIITADVFPGPTLARQMVRQDWGCFNLDAFLPMLYNVFYNAGPEWVEKETREGVATVKQPIYSGLFIGHMDDAAIAALVKSALKGGASGVSLFSSHDMDEAKWKAFGKICA